MESEQTTRRSERRLLAAVLLVGLAARLGWGLSRPADDAAINLLPDQRGYLESARNLLRGAGLWYVDERFGEAGQAVYAVRTPGYPAFVALCGGSVRVVRAAQALLDTSTALAVYLLACRLLPRPAVAGAAAHVGVFARGDRVSLKQVRHGCSGWESRTGADRNVCPTGEPALDDHAVRQTRHGLAPLLASALVAFNPFLLYFSGLLLTETLYTAMLAWGMVLLALSRRGWPRGVLLLVLGIHVRPAGVGLPVVLAAVGAWVRSGDVARAGDGPDVAPARREGRGPVVFRAALAGGVAALLTVAALLPWAWRNHVVLGRWVWSTSNDGITAYDGFHPGATGASDQSFETRMPELDEMGELQRSDYLAAGAKRFVRANPGRVAELTVAKVARTWSPVPLSAEFGTPRHRAVALMFTLPFDALVVAGLVAGRLPRRAKLFLLLPALYVTAIHALSVGSLRYRVPAEPPLAVLAAAGAARLLGGPTKTTADDAPPAPSVVR